MRRKPSGAGIDADVVRIGGGRLDDVEEVSRDR